MVYVPTVEAVVNFLQAVGIRTKLRGLERASFQKSDQEKKLKLARVGSPAACNAATRIEAFVVSTGSRATAVSRTSMASTRRKPVSSIPSGARQS
jgi:hypothetical protein